MTRFASVSSILMQRLITESHLQSDAVSSSLYMCQLCAQPCQFLLKNPLVVFFLSSDFD